MSRDCCVALPRGAMGCLQFVIVVFPGHTHLLFIIVISVIAPLGFKDRVWFGLCQFLVTAHVVFVQSSTSTC